jgi:hypothetical protein
MKPEFDEEQAINALLSSNKKEKTLESPLATDSIQKSSL